MATITFKAHPIQTQGEIPAVDTKAPDFTLTSGDLSEKSLSDFAGKFVVLNIFPSIDTGTCAASVRHFNQSAAALEDTVVLCISKDLPFAQNRFCGAEGISNVVTLSDFKDDKFTEAYPIKILDGPLAGLLSRVVVVIDKDGKIIYTQQVDEIADEPNYDAALAAIK